MKHISIFIMLLVATCICSAQELGNRSIEALQYLYPGGSYSYTMMPRNNPILGYKTFYVDANNVLHSESKIIVNGRNINNDDLYQFVLENGNIVCYQHRHHQGCVAIE